MLTTCTLLLVALATTHGVEETGFEAVSRGGGWVPERLDLSLTVDPEERELLLEGTIRLRLTIATSPGPTLAANFRDFVMDFEEVSADGATVTLDDDPEVPNRANLVAAHVRFDEPRTEGEVVDVRFRMLSYRDGAQFIVEPRVAYGSWVMGWYPIPAPLPGVAPSKRLREAPGTTTLDLPESWSGVTNGARTARVVEGGRARETWESTLAVSRSFVAARYQTARHEIDGRSIGVHLLTEKAQSAEMQATRLAEALRAQEARFGPYPYPTYAIAEFPDDALAFYASSEQGFIVAKSAAFGWEHGNLPLFAHEMAHGWWGNRVGTAGPGSILMNETLAQYSAVIAIETLEGEEAATEFLRFSRSGYSDWQCAEGYFRIRRQGNDKPLGQLKSGGFDHHLSDSKGMWVMHMLRRRVGDDVFFGRLRSFVENSDRDLSVARFREEFGAAAPDAGLEAFFEQWLEQEGAPLLALDWTPRDGGGVTVDLRQEQAGEPYALDVELDVVPAEGPPTVHVVRLDQRNQAFELAIDGAPTEVRLDPRHRLLRWTPEYGPRPEADRTD